MSYKGYSEYATPNIDALATGGIDLACNYASITCAPARAALFTSRWPHRVGLDLAYDPPSPRFMDADIPTLAEILQSAGYRTGIFGKWHLGSMESSQLPCARGFDVFEGFLMGAIHNYAKKSCVNPLPVFSINPDILAAMQALPPLDTCLHDYFTCDAEEGAAGNSADDDPTNDGVTPTLFEEDTIYAPQFQLDGALRFIEQSTPNPKKHSSSEEPDPFFLYFPTGLPHTPIEDPPSFGGDDHLTECDVIDETQGLPQERRRLYCRMTQWVDRSMGAIVDKLKERHVWDNTLFVFLSDNGGTPGIPQNPNALFSGWGQNIPLRGVKTTSFEGGIRTVSFVNGGILDRQHRGTTYEHMFWVGDWLPTILELLGEEDLTPQDIDGVSHANQMFPSKKRGKQSSEDSSAVGNEPPRDTYISMTYLFGVPTPHFVGTTLIKYPFKLIVAPSVIRPRFGLDVIPSRLPN